MIKLLINNSVSKSNISDDFKLLETNIKNINFMLIMTTNQFFF